MDRKQFLRLSGLAFAGTFLPPLVSQSKFNLIKAANFTELRRNTGFFTGGGGTIGWLASSDAMVVIDSQFPDSAQECYDGLQKRTERSLELLINTHHHADHTGGNSVFKEANMKVAHANCPKLQKEFNSDRGPQVYADTVFQKSWKTDVGDETIHLYHYGPAHTGGDAIVVFEKANVIHLGDLVFNRWYPFIDEAAGASIQNWKDTLTKVTDEFPSDAIYIFGHGKEAFGVKGSRKDVIVMRDYLSAILHHVETGLLKEKSKQEIMDIEQLQAFPDHVSPGSERLSLKANLEVAYNELQN